LKQLSTESKLARPAYSMLLASAMARLQSHNIVEIEESEHSEDNVNCNITAKTYSIL